MDKVVDDLLPSLDSAAKACLATLSNAPLESQS